jgi:hypothetical protein
MDIHFGEKNYMVTISKDCTGARTIFGHFHIQSLFLLFNEKE